MSRHKERWLELQPEGCNPVESVVALRYMYIYFHGSRLTARSNVTESFIITFDPSINVAHQTIMLIFTNKAETERLDCGDSKGGNHF